MTQKLTAIQWLRKQVEAEAGAEISPKYREMFDLAIAIERQQIVEAVLEGWQQNDGISNYPQPLTYYQNHYNVTTTNYQSND